MEFSETMWLVAARISSAIVILEKDKKRMYKKKEKR